MKKVDLSIFDELENQGTPTEIHNDPENVVKLVEDPVEEPTSEPEVKEEPKVEPVVEEEPEISESIEEEEVVVEEEKDLNVYENQRIVEEKAEEPKPEPTIVKDEDGTIKFNEVIMEDIKLDSDSEEDMIEMNEIPSLYVSTITEEYKKPLLFEKSDLTIKKSTPDDAISVLRGLKYYGEYLDVYLPVSNVAVRIYEFDLDIFLDTGLEAIRSFEIDRGFAFSQRELALSKQLFKLIQENCEILCADGGTKLDFDSLAYADVNYLLLGTLALLQYVTNDKKNYKYKFSLYCDKCKQPISVETDLLDLLKQQYMKSPMAKEIQAAIDGYSMDETLADKFKKSKLYTAKRLRTLLKKRNTMVYVLLREPSYGAYNTVEEQMNDFLLKKYASEIEALTTRFYSEDIAPGISSFNTVLSQFKYLSSKRKLSVIMQLIAYINRYASEEINLTLPISVHEIQHSYLLCKLIPYIRKIDIEVNANDPKLAKTSSFVYDENTPEQKFDMIHEITNNKVILDGIIKNINENFMTNIPKPLEINYKCGNCENKGRDEREVIDLFFMIIEGILTKRS